MLKKQTSGFTLIELMAVVAIIGILAAIAIPSYQESMRKSRRADAQGALLNFATGMERHFTQFNSYCDALTAVKTTASTAADCDGGGNDTGNPPGQVFAPRGETAAFYGFTISAAAPSTYTLRATPVAGGAQSTDGMIELLSTGERRWDENNDGAFAVPGEINWDKGH